MTTTAQRVAARIDNARNDGRHEERHRILAKLDAAAAHYPIEQYSYDGQFLDEVVGAALRQWITAFAAELRAEDDGTDGG